jgi:hypothetical protein
LLDAEISFRKTGQWERLYGINPYTTCYTPL